MVTISVHREGPTAILLLSELMHCGYLRHLGIILLLFVSVEVGSLEFWRCNGFFCGCDDDYLRL